MNELKIRRKKNEIFRPVAHVARTIAKQTISRRGKGCDVQGV